MRSIKYYHTNYKAYKVNEVNHRYITNAHITPFLNNLSNRFIVSVLGYSENQRPIFGVKYGNGNKKILIWSQMHGNESTSTKALLDLFNTIENENEAMFNACTLMVIPILNPDGAQAYTRLNANKVDLNRDAQHLTQAESKILRQCFDDFSPQYCFNLHGQRTLFSAGACNYPATLSFLSPAVDEQGSINTTRSKAMQVISEICGCLQDYLPNQIGRYDDAYNINCVGDQFQTLNVPTILFEAGHYSKDYSREKCRIFLYLALLKSIDYIATNTSIGDHFKSYFDIPENQKLFYDVLLRNVILKTGGNVCDVGILYKENLCEDHIKFQPYISSIGDLSNYYGHHEIDGGGSLITHPDHEELSTNIEIDFVLNKINKKLHFGNNNLT